MSSVMNNPKEKIDADFLNAYPDLYTNYQLRGEQNVQLRKEALEKARVEMNRKNEENIDAAFFKAFPKHFYTNKKRDEVLEKNKRRFGACERRRGTYP